MKTKIKLCENCKENTIHSNKKVMSSKRMKLRRTIERCYKCGKTTIKNFKSKNTYTKKLGGSAKV